MKQVTPPFVPNVESDESTANFDPEFTSADLGEAGIDTFIDEDDPSEEWVSRSIHDTVMHTPNGPLGSDMREQQARAIQITRSRKHLAPQGSPISNSVQENFRGFSFMGESLMGNAAGRLTQRDNDEDALDDEGHDPSTEDEYEDDQRPAGRFGRGRGMDEGIII